MKRALALLLAAALAVTLTACGGEPIQPVESQTPAPTAPAERQPFALAYDPGGSLHPITGFNQVNLDLAPLVYEGLYELDNTFTAQPVLAGEASVSEDGLTWTIALKSGVCFSDGTPLTADHVAASLNTARSSTLYASRLSGVASVQAGDGEVSIVLSAPNGALPALLDIPVVLEQENGIPLGTGRYRFAGEGDSFALVVNPNYDGDDGLPYDGIPLRAVTTADERIAAFDSGEVTAVTTDFSSAYALGYSGSYETCDYPTTNLIYVGFRTTAGPCQSPQVRQAFSRLFDRVSVVKSLLAGHGDPACLPISPSHGDYDESAAALLDYDVQQAEELLAAAGYARGEDGLWYSRRTSLAVTLIVNSDSVAKQNIADYLAASLEGMGVTVTVKKLAWEDYEGALKKGNFDLYIGEVRLTGDFDPTQLLTGSLNYGGYSSEAVSALLTAWRAAQGEVRTQAAEQLWLALAEEVPLAPLCFKRGSLLVRWGMVTNLQPTRGDPFHHMEDWVRVS